MKKLIHPLLKYSLLLGCVLAPDSVLGQIVPDATLRVNSSVTQSSNKFTINGGTLVGGNLFHSFQHFNVPTGSEAYFNNAPTIENIFTRVTGGSISNIDGILRANGSANLFLLNPNGIIFGPNASLNIGGSFIGSSANSIKFADGTQFSATNQEAAPLLTVNVPMGLQFGTNPPGNIIVQGTGHNLTWTTDYLPSIHSSSQGLRVQPGKTLALVGGFAKSGGSRGDKGDKREGCFQVLQVLLISPHFLILPTPHSPTPVASTGETPARRWLLPTPYSPHPNR